MKKNNNRTSLVLRASDIRSSRARSGLDGIRIPNPIACSVLTATRVAGVTGLPVQAEYVSIMAHGERPLCPVRSVGDQSNGGIRFFLTAKESGGTRS